MNDPLLLISKHFYDTLTDEEAVALNAWICQDAANARLFAHEAIVHRNLRSEWVGQKICQQFLDATEMPTPAPLVHRSAASMPETSRWWGRNQSVAAVTIATCLLAMVWIGFGGLNQLRPGPALPAVVHLAKAFDTTWGATATAPNIGPLSLEPRTLDAGTISLKFAGGAEVIIDGPASFEPLSATQMRLTSGRVVVSCPTPESRGFELMLPGFRVTDLGTEFGVFARADNAELHVFEGSVSVRGSATSEADAKIYRQYDACRLTYNNGRSEAIPVDGAVFVRPFDFRMLETKSQWAQYAHKLRRDRDLLFWSDLTPGSHGQLLNAAPFVNNGVRILAPRTALQLDAGRQKGSSALKVINNQHAVQLQIPGSFQNLTLAAWVKFFPERRNARDHRGILMSDGWGLPGQIHWQRKARDFRLTFPRLDATDHARYLAETTQLDDGKWHLLVTVVDGQRERRVVQYLDGDELSNESLNIPFRSIQLGNCTLGGWQAPRGNRENRSLNGLIDELLIWKRALDSSEVEALYRASL